MRRVISCPNKHFYDADEFAECPHCKKEGLLTPTPAAGTSNQQGQGKANDDKKPSKWIFGKKKKKEQDKSRDNATTIGLFDPNPISRDLSISGDAEQSQNGGGSSQQSQIPQNGSGNSQQIPQIQPQVAPQPEPSSQVSQTPISQTPAPQHEPSSQVSQTPVPQPVPIPQQSEPASQTPPPLAQDIAQMQVDKDDIKTMSIYGFASNNEPVVGWLVAVAGTKLGVAYELHTGKNRIGRAADMDIVINDDKQISRDKHATIMYEPRSRQFYLLSGESNGMTYVNDAIVMENTQLSYKDKILMGETVFMFVPLCGEDFTWDDYIDKGEK